MAKDNAKALRETRADKLEELKVLYAKVEGEQRAITEEEEKQVKAIQDEIASIDKTLKVLEEMRAQFVDQNEEHQEEKKDEERAQDEEKMFADYLRGIVTENRAGELTLTDNGAIIPSTIANKIIQKVYDISPVLSRATKYNIKGNLTIPFYPKDADDITMDYAEEFVELTSTTGKFDSISLKGYLAGVLTLVSRSLMNNAQFDIVSFVTNHMAYNVSRWIEKQLLIGTEGKIAGLSSLDNVVTAAKADAVTVDELIDVQAAIKDNFQSGAIWIMSPKTRTAINKLKDGNGRYLLQDDVTAPFGKVLLGKPVFVSDNMPDMEAGKLAMYYGDMSGLAVKLNENLQVQVLREKYATQHAVGVVGWVEMDSKVENAQKLVKLVMKEA